MPKKKHTALIIIFENTKLTLVEKKKFFFLRENKILYNWGGGGGDSSGLRRLSRRERESGWCSDGVGRVSGMDTIKARGFALCVYRMDTRVGRRKGFFVSALDTDVPILFPLCYNIT